MLNTDHARKAINDRGLKISWVAGQIGVKPDTLGKFLSGKINLGPQAQDRLMRLLGLDKAG